MTAYYILVFVPLILGFIKNDKMSNKLNHKDNKVITSFFIIFLSLLVLRANTVGVDLQNYIPFFLKTAKVSWNNLFVNTTSEPGYRLVNRVIASISTNIQFFLSIIALVSILPIWKLYKREAKNSFLTISIFLVVAPFSMFFSGLRQSIAIGLGALAFQFVKNKKLIPFLLTVALAFTFHNSAIVLFLMYPFYHLKITKRWLLLVIPAMAIGLKYNTTIFKVLSPLFGDKYFDLYGQMQSTGAYTMLILFVLFCVFAYVVPDENNMDSSMIGLRNIMLLITFIQFFAPLNSVAMRINYYYLIFVPILIPKIIDCSSNNLKNIAKMAELGMSTFFTIYFLYTGYVGNDILQIFPYIPFWRA